ncbi:hypothetical protein R6Q57_014613 [Mikania cordata]
MYSDNASSDSISRDINSLLYSSTFKHPADGEFAKIKHLISLDPLPTYDYYQNQYQFPNQQQEDDCFGENQSSLLIYFNWIRDKLGSSSSPSRFLPPIAETKSELQDSTFNRLKRSRDGVLKMTQNGETGNYTAKLVHHMSLPKTSSEMAVVENFLQFQQESTVPWKTRAKRGFATHPRSIAERVRRTRISERIKRLQDLLPDMDKQSNTADMLDMAVEYIKNLQKELQGSIKLIGLIHAGIGCVNAVGLEIEKKGEGIQKKRCGFHVNLIFRFPLSHHEFVNQRN